MRVGYNQGLFVEGSLYFGAVFKSMSPLLVAMPRAVRRSRSLGELPKPWVLDPKGGSGCFHVLTLTGVAACLKASCHLLRCIGGLVLTSSDDLSETLLDPTPKPARSKPGPLNTKQLS